MKDKTKKYLTFILCAVLTVSFYLYLCMIVTPKSSKDSGGTLYYGGTGFMAEPENSLDLLIYGNSDVYSGFSPQILYNEFGIKSYASGKAKQDLSGVKSLINKTLKTQKPKIVILETDCFYQKSSVKLDKIELLYSPFVYHSRWKEIKLRDFHKIPSRKEKLDKNKGYMHSEATGKYTFKNYMGNPDSKPRPIPEENLKIIKECINICKDNGIKVILLEIPSAASWNYSKHNAVKKLAANNNVDFIDMNINPKDYGFDFSRDFRDNGNHLNIYGAEKVTKFIGEYLNHKYPELISSENQELL